MKIMTFNTQHCLDYIQKKIDYPIMADVIRQFDPDIVGLNEMYLKGTDVAFEPQTAILSELTGMPYNAFAKAIDVGENNPYGNGILSKIPFSSVQTIPIPDPVPKQEYSNYESRCLLKAELENGVTVLVTHFGLNPDEQQNAVQTVLEHIRDEKCILMGDFNVLPDNAVLSPIRARMKDAAEKFCDPLYSYPSDAPNIKIDYLFVSPDIEVIEADIPAVVASDHRPHTATIKF